MKTDMELREQLDGARVWAQREKKALVWGILAGDLADVLADDVPTACTDGRVIRWGREFLSQLTTEEVRYVLLHEVDHVVSTHLWLLPPNQRGNLAADRVVERHLRDIPGCTMPAGGIVCEAQLMDRTEAEIYDWLPDPPEGQGKGGSIGDFTEPVTDGDQGQSKAEAQAALRKQWERNTAAAVLAAQAAGCGVVPESIGRQLNRVLAAQIDWRAETADFLRNLRSSKNDWTRSHRRFACAPVIYPRRKPNEPGTVVCHRDTSGSISARQCAEQTALISSLAEEIGCPLIVLDGDTELHAEHHLAPGEECPLIAQGGGGTDHHHVFERVQSLQDEGHIIAGVVCLTDLDTVFPDPPELPVLWLTDKPRTAPFGRTVRVS